MKEEFIFKTNKDGFLLEDSYRIVLPKFIPDGTLPPVWVVELDEYHTSLYNEESDHGSFFDWLTGRLEQFTGCCFTDFEHYFLDNVIVLSKCEYEEEEEE